MKIKKHLKILAVIGAVILLVFVILLLDNFVGNPVTSASIKSQAETLVKTEYGDLDYEVSSVTYDRTRKTYFVDVTSETSIDSSFTLSYSRNGSFNSNTYNSQVDEKSNTHMRLLNQYHQSLSKLDTVYNVNGEKPDYLINFGGYISTPSSSELVFDKIYSAAELNEIAIEYGTVTVYVEHENPSLEVSADIIKMANDLLSESGISFNNLSFSMYKIPFEKGVEAEFRFEGLLLDEIIKENFIEILETKKVNHSA